MKRFFLGCCAAATAIVAWGTVDTVIQRRKWAAR